MQVVALQFSWGKKQNTSFDCIDISQSKRTWVECLSRREFFGFFFLWEQHEGSACTVQKCKVHAAHLLTAGQTRRVQMLETKSCLWTESSLTAAQGFRQKGRWFKSRDDSVCCCVVGHNNAECTNVKGCRELVEVDVFWMSPVQLWLHGRCKTVA